MIKVLGLGNTLRGDDGIGQVIISELLKNSLSLNIEAIDIGSDTLTVLDYLRGEDPVIIIDCARMGKFPGEIVKFKIDNANLDTINEAISLHGFGFSEVYKMAEGLGNVADCTIIGVEPKSIEFNSKLSKEVEKSIPLVLEMVVEETKKYVKKNINH